MKREFRILSWTITWIIILISGFHFFFSAGYPWKISSLEPYLLRSPGDDWTHNTFEIQRLKRISSLLNKEQTLVIFLGGSVALESITTDQEISSLLSKDSNKDIIFKSLCSSHKSFSDEIKIIDALGKINATIVFISEAISFKPSKKPYQLSIPLLRGTPEEYEHQKYYALPASNYLKRILEEYNYKVGIKHRTVLFRTFMYLGEYFKKKAYSIIFKKFPLKLIHDRHFAKGEPVDKERAIKFSRSLDKPVNMNYVELQFKLFNAAIHLAKTNGNQVIIVESPINPLFKDHDRLKRFEPVYDKRIQKLVKEKDCAYIDLRHSIEWRPEDFRDVHHMLPSGSEKYTSKLASELVSRKLI